MTRPAARPPVVLVDLSAFIWRAFHAVPPRYSPDGLPVNAVAGVIAMLLRPILARSAQRRIALVWDGGGPTWRHALSCGYKADRPPPEIVPQFTLVRAAAEAWGVSQVALPGWEADDLIATAARLAVAAGERVTIVGSDKDLMQLVRDGAVALYDRPAKTWVRRAEVEARLGVPPELVCDVLALAGDPGDGVPGVPRVGLKTAARLVRSFNGLDGVLRQAPALSQPGLRAALVQHADTARRCRRLVALRDDVPLPIGLEELLRPPQPDRTAIGNLLRRLGLDRAASPC